MNTDESNSRKSRIYAMWSNIKQRTSNPRCKYYADYGGRGITMYPPWQDSFNDFWFDVITLPRNGDTLDRIDNSKGYQPGNLRWVSMQAQNRNRRSNTKLTLNGETLLLCEWSERTGISRSLICARIGRLGWSVERALTTPTGKAHA